MPMIDAPEKQNTSSVELTSVWDSPAKKKMVLVMEPAMEISMTVHSVINSFLCADSAAQQDVTTTQPYMSFKITFKPKRF